MTQISRKENQDSTAFGLKKLEPALAQIATGNAEVELWTRRNAETGATIVEGVGALSALLVKPELPATEQEMKSTVLGYLTLLDDAIADATSNSNTLTEQLEDLSDKLDDLEDSLTRKMNTDLAVITGELTELKSSLTTHITSEGKLTRNVVLAAEAAILAAIQRNSGGGSGSPDIQWLMLVGFAVTIGTTLLCHTLDQAAINKVLRAVTEIVDALNAAEVPDFGVEIINELYGILLQISADFTQINIEDNNLTVNLVKNDNRGLDSVLSLLRKHDEAVRPYAYNSLLSRARSPGRAQLERTSQPNVSNPIWFPPKPNEETDPDVASKLDIYTLTSIVYRYFSGAKCSIKRGGHSNTDWQAKSSPALG